MKLKKLLKQVVKEFKDIKNKTNPDENLLNKLDDSKQKQIDKNLKQKEFDDALKLVNM